MSPWQCTICEESDEWNSKDRAKDHVKDNHIETLVAMSIEFEDREEGMGHEPIREQ